MKISIHTKFDAIPSSEDKNIRISNPQYFGSIESNIFEYLTLFDMGGHDGPQNVLTTVPKRLGG